MCILRGQSKKIKQQTALSCWSDLFAMYMCTYVIKIYTYIPTYLESTCSAFTFVGTCRPNVMLLACCLKFGVVVAGSKFFCDPSSCLPTYMYHIESLHIHAAAGEATPPYTGQTESPTIPLQLPPGLTTSDATQAPVTPRIEAGLTADTVLYQKRNGLCCHFWNCSYIRGRKNQILTAFQVCSCLHVLQIGDDEKTPP